MWLANTRDHWDTGRLQQLLDNLVGNAVKHGTANAPVHVSLVGGATDIRLEIRNSGLKIDEAMLLEMFAPLRRGVIEGTRPYDDTGLGLGLYIAREIAKAHGGTIEAESTQSETTFVVTLPRRSAAP